MRSKKMSATSRASSLVCVLVEDENCVRACREELGEYGVPQRLQSNEPTIFVSSL